jgi:sulfate adenylyltransferase subunit 1 (EFTu-like GTPase family)
MDVLKIATAGSVDDGKSSLIGRLLYETESIPTDKFIAIEQDLLPSANKASPSMLLISISLLLPAGLLLPIHLVMWSIPAI